MKNLSSLFTCVFLYTLLCTLLLISCEPDEDLAVKPVVDPTVQPESNIILPNGDSPMMGLSTNTSNPCSQSFSGTYYGTGYHTYPNKTINLTGIASGTVITVNLYAADIPNRFNIKTTGGTLLATSNWMGYANYQGPWGSSINTPNTKTITFTKGTANTYYLSVETMAQGMSDYWNASVSCPSGSCTNCPCVSYTCPPPGGDDCTPQSFSGTYSGTGYHTYPNKTINLTGIASGTVITVNLYAADIPNRFNIKTTGGALLATSNWMGYANYQGPWGSSINTPNTKTITFTKGTANTYYLSVETMAQGMSDYWNASVSCP